MWSYASSVCPTEAEAHSTLLVTCKFGDVFGSVQFGVVWNLFLILCAELDKIYFAERIKLV